MIDNEFRTTDLLTKDKELGLKTRKERIIRL